MPVSHNANSRLKGASRTGATSALIANTVLVASLIAALGITLLSQNRSNELATKEAQSLNPSEHSAALASADPEQLPQAPYPIQVNRPLGPPRVDTGLTNPHGDRLTVSCSICHAAREPNFENKTAADLDEFHHSLEFAHGSITCLSCHNPNDYDALKLADGTRVEYTEVMDLCAQCHGPQMRDFEQGVHGGMRGFWDLNRGPQTKNNCIDCHHPHAPKFPKMQPTFKPQDRFLEDPGH